MDALIGSEQPSLADQTRRHAVARRVADAETRIARFKSALAQGVDAALVGQWIEEAVSDLGHARAALAALPNEQQHDLAREDVLALVTNMSLVMQRLSEADPDDKAALYAALGLHLTYDHVAGAITAEVSTSPRWVKERVRGGT